MPLNYSKWDQLELSDDSDIEGHPNVDKRSLIRWKQRDIHEKRETRKQRIAYLHAQIDCNNVLLPRITAIAGKLAVEQNQTTYFSGLVERLEKEPSKECPPGNDPEKLEHTYDGMLLDLLSKVSQEAKEKVKEDGVPEGEKNEKIGRFLAERMEYHVKHLGEMIEKDKEELEGLVKEQKKHITSDDLHDGFDSKYVPTKAEAQSKTKKTKEAKTTTTYEVLNPQAAETATPPAPVEDDEADDEAEEMPELTPSVEKFSRIPLWSYEHSLQFIQEHRDVIAEGSSDALLVAAFKAEQAGQKRYAKQCVHQSLVLQYGEKLGPDGFRLFFKKMIAQDPRAIKVFKDDVEKTYQHLETRVKSTLEEEPEGREQIQLVPEGANQDITFNVPDGPPPEDLRLEGPGTENLDIEEVRKALQFRWTVFSGFPKDLQEALQSGELVRVNEVLASMDVPTAEQVVQSLDMAGILGFAEGGIRDETGKGAATEA